MEHSIEDKNLLTSKELRKIPRHVKRINILSIDHCIIPFFPNFITTLLISNCRITELPKLPTKLKKIGLENIDIKYLPDFPNTLEVIKIYDLPFLYKISSLPCNLKEFYLIRTNVRELSKLPENLKELFLILQNEVFLPRYLPDSLKVLAISFSSDNTSLPILPKNLDKLLFLNCNLLAVPKLPNVKEFICFKECKIKILPKLPDKIGEIKFINTDISNFPKFTEYYYKHVDKYICFRYPKNKYDYMYRFKNRYINSHKICIDYTKSYLKPESLYRSNFRTDTVFSNKISRYMLLHFQKIKISTHIIENKTEYWNLVPYHPKCVNIRSYFNMIIKS
ncbi:MAG TPA: hypothetical protein V6C58_17435 [Allocoleopsis sp.]